MKQLTTLLMVCLLSLGIISCHRDSVQLNPTTNSIYNTTWISPDSSGVITITRDSVFYQVPVRGTSSEYKYGGRLFSYSYKYQVWGVSDTLVTSNPKNITVYYRPNISTDSGYFRFSRITKVSMDTLSQYFAGSGVSNGMFIKTN